MNALIASYRIDSQDIILNHSGDIAPFARMHGGALLGLAPEAAAGSHWLGEIRGDSLRLYLRLLATAVRVAGEPFSYPYRGCADGIRYEMEFQVVPLKHGEIALDHFLRGSQSCVESHLLVAADETRQLAVRCCTLCGRINQGYGWDTREAAMRTMPWPAGAEVAAVFTICWDCSETLGPKISALLSGSGQNALELPGLARAA